VTARQPAAVLIVLTDGDGNLAHYLDLLREDGLRVLATSRTHEVFAELAKHPTAALLVRAAALREDAMAFFLRARNMMLDPWVILTAGAHNDVASTLPCVDVTLREPFLYSALRDALGCQAVASAASSEERTDTSSTSEPSAAVSGAHNWLRVVDYARGLTLAESDRAKLLDIALEMFQDMADAQAGALWIAPAPDEPIELVHADGISQDILDRAPGSGAVFACLHTGRSALANPSLLPLASNTSTDEIILVPLAIPTDEQRTVHGLVLLMQPRAQTFSLGVLAELDALAAHLVACLRNSRKFDELNNMAVVDPLTGLFNRRYFDRQFAVELKRAERHGRNLTLVLMDVDKFKTIHDLNGYATGDGVIRAVADVIRRGFRDVDVVTRWGGDEFAILMPDARRPRTQRAGIHEVSDPVQRVRTLVERTNFARLLPRLRGKVTVCAGVGVYPDNGSDRDMLFASVNQALQRAKRHGPSTVFRAREEPLEEAPTDSVGAES
jgi:diguanylate cyclase (GGDEF)-like protein